MLCRVNSVYTNLRQSLVFNAYAKNAPTTISKHLEVKDLLKHRNSIEWNILYCTPTYSKYIIVVLNIR